ncbi:MAG: lipid A deacylase LpxR family protein [Cyclobacteriaceae bacterium]
MRKITIFLIYFVSNAIVAQEKLNYEIDLSVDNDAFYLIAAEDEYYSSGIFASFRRPLRTESGLYKLFNRREKVANFLQGIHFSHLMYTPDDIRIRNVNLLDRPYAGGFSFGYSYSLFVKSNWHFSLQQDLGIMGPATKTGELQKWWHGLFNMNEPRGWQYEINNTPYISTKLEVVKSVRITDPVDILYESKYEFGTIFNYINQGLTLRLGKLQGIGYSGYKNGLIGTEYIEERRHQTIEWYIFWGFAFQYVFYNATIEGNLIGSEPVYTEEASEWLLMRKSGLNLHWQTFDLGIHFYFNTAETTESDAHRYIRIRLTKRF